MFPLTVNETFFPSYQDSQKKINKLFVKASRNHFAGRPDSPSCDKINAFGSNDPSFFLMS
jgi:hypothetical protein